MDVEDGIVPRDRWTERSEYPSMMRTAPSTAAHAVMTAANATTSRTSLDLLKAILLPQLVPRTILPVQPALSILPCTIAAMARYTLVYGVRLVPEGTLKGATDATLTLSDGETAGVTLHTIDGTIPQLRRAMDRSLDAFFDLLPGADDEDVEKFGD